jgi:hypothetical protein
MLSSIWLLSALCATALSSPTLPLSSDAGARSVEMKVLSEYFQMLGSKVQAGRQMAQAPVCNLNNAVMPVAGQSLPSCLLTPPVLTVHSTNASSAANRRPSVETRGHWQRNPELLLRQQRDRCARSSWRRRDPLQCLLYSIQLPRPAIRSPQRGTTIQSQRRQPSYSVPVQPSYQWAPLLPEHHNANV